MNSLRNPELASKARLLVDWYRAPTTLTYLVSAAVTLVLALAGETVAAVIVAFMIATVWLPYKLARERSTHARTRTELLAHADRAVQEAGAQGDRRARESATVMLNEWSETLDTTRDELRGEWNDSLGVLRDDVRKSLDVLIDRMAAEHQQYLELIETVRAERTDLFAAERHLWRSALSQAANRSEGRLMELRRHHALAMARCDDSGDSIGRILLVVAPQRSGSTWFFDLLRTNPRVVVRPLADIYEWLGVEGNRYPGDLSNGRGDQIDIEIRRGLGATIPRLHAASVVGGIGSADHIALEKVHPSAIGFDAGEFVRRLRAVESEWSTTVQLVYLVREPLETILSFLAYQQRSSTWHPSTAREEVIEHCQRSLEVISDLHGELGGSIVSYEQLLADPAAELARVFQECELSPTVRDAVETAMRAVETVSIDRLSSQASGPFIGAKDEGVRADLELGRGFGDQAAARLALERCSRLYHELVGEGAEHRDAELPTVEE